MGTILNLEEATEKADYYSAIACRAILTALETEEVLTKHNRKIVLDAVNDFKRNIIRSIYDAT
jgi:hypothetical protein